MSTTLPLFWHISSASKKDRLDASFKLITSLEQFQAQYVPHKPDVVISDEDDASATNSDGLDALNAEDVSYSIRRLIRGLASPRESSRLGFAVALTELLARISTVTSAQILSLVLDSSKAVGSMTGQEERDVHFARLFGLTAIIQSGLLVRQNALPASASSQTSPSSLSAYMDTINNLIALGEKKSWLRESAWWSVALAIDAVNASGVSWKEDALKGTAQTILVQQKEWSPEKIALTLKLQSVRPQDDWRGYLCPPFKVPDLLVTSNLSAIARILKESSFEDEDDSHLSTSAARSWKPELPFVWDVILDALLPRSKVPTEVKGSFKEFFRIVVDESLFSSTSSAERKYWGFQVFRKALVRIKVDDLPLLFTKNFMRSWINHLSKQDRYLHKIAKQVAADMQDLVQKNTQLGFTLVLQLTGVNGNRQFDKLTKTKTVESILASMDAEGIENYIEYLLKQVNEFNDSEKDDIHTINAKRNWIVEQMAALIRNGSVPKSDGWMQSVLDWLVVNGLFLVKKPSSKSSYRALRAVPVPAFSEEFRKNCRARLYSCLADLTSQSSVASGSGDTTAAKRAVAVASDGKFWVQKVLGTIETLQKDKKHVALLADEDEDDSVLRSRAREALADAEKIEDQETIKGAILLLSATLLQHYDENVDSEVFSDCIDAVSRMVPGHKKSKKSKDDAAESAPEPIDILVDIIIGFLERSTAYMRAISNHVFSLLSESVQESTIDLILTQLERRDPAELLKDDEDEDDTEGEDDEKDEDSDSDDDDDEEDDEDSNDEEEDSEIRRKIEEALRVNGIEAATSDDDGDSDEELMDDDQMIAMDEKLAEVFRAQMDEKKSGKDVDAQREATHFKNRVLDLVDIFIRKQPTNSHIVRLILPLIELIVGTGSDEQQLSDKATSILKTRVGKLKEVPSAVDLEQLSKVFNELHSRSHRVHSSDILAIISQCSLYVSKLAVHAKGEEYVVAAYRDSLNDFIKRKASPLNSKFFEDAIRRHPSVGWSLRESILNVSAEAANVYRQCQAFFLLYVVIGQLPLIEDSQSDVTTFMSALQKVLYDTMQSACESSSATLTAAQMKELFRLVLLAIRQTMRVVPVSEPAPIWHAKDWESLQQQLATSERYKASPALQTMSKQVVQLLTASSSNSKSEVKGGKRKAEGETEQSLKKAKRKKAKALKDA